jgi:hypothetical protein
MKHQDITLKDIYDSVEKLRKEVADTYVSKVEFEPVRKIVYGIVSLILTGVIGALIAIAVRAQ